MNPIGNLRICNMLAEIDVIHKDSEPAPRCAFLHARSPALVGVAFEADLQFESAILHCFALPLPTNL